MSLRKLNSIFFAAALVFAVVSCKKDKETGMSLPALNGTLKAEVPEFMTPGKKVTMKPYGISHPEGGTIGYCWKVSPTMTKYDTADVFEFTPTDTLQTVSIICYAFADNYSTSSASYSSTVVKGGLDGSLKGLGINKEDTKITVDGTDYYYVRIGDKDWFRNNLASVSAGAPFRNSAVMSDVFGCFYSYEEALTACPQGWRLPSEEDWLSLAKACGAPASLTKYDNIPGIVAKLMADATFNDIVLWEYWPAVGEITNSAKMAVVPAGYANLGDKRQDGKYPHAIFSGVYEYAAFWTSDIVAEEQDKAYYRYILDDQPYVFAGKGDRLSFGANVRCVRDAK